VSGVIVPPLALGANPNSGPKRRANWERRLIWWCDGNRERPFEWGVFDCALAAADAVELLTGEDPAAEFRGRYRSAKGALTVIKNSGYGSLEGLVTHQIGKPLASPKLAQRGDLVLAELDHGPTLLVCVGAQAFGPGVAGLVPVPMARWTRAWRVG